MDRGAWRARVHKVTESDTTSNYHNLNVHVYLNIARTATGTSLVVQWLRLCLAMQGTQVQ